MRFWARVLLIAALAAIVAAFTVTNFTTKLTLANFLRHLLSALIYSAAISLGASLSMMRLGRTPLAARRGVSILLPVATLLVVNVAGCLAGAFIKALVGLMPWSEYWQEFGSTINLATAITLIFGLSMYFYQGLWEKLEAARGELHRREIADERARKLLAEAKLSSLESRIHPHFLFNTLNSVASLIPKDPKQAEAMVWKLASLLRFSLNANQGGLVPLGQEIRIVRDYLEIEQARFGPRLRYSIDVPPALAEAGVPPLALQSLVENSVKHVVARRPEGGEIRIAARRESGRIDLEVLDDGPGFRLDEIPPGHGLDNLSARLALLFGPAAGLSTARENGFAGVRVSLPPEGVREG